MIPPHTGSPYRFYRTRRTRMGARNWKSGDQPRSSVVSRRSLVVGKNRWVSSRAFWSKRVTGRRMWTEDGTGNWDGPGIEYRSRSRLVSVAEARAPIASAGLTAKASDEIPLPQASPIFRCCHPLFLWGWWTAVPWARLPGHHLALQQRAYWRERQ